MATNAKPPIVDVGATCADILLYRLRAVSADLTISGIFLNTSNERVGLPITCTVPAAESVTFEQMYAAVYDPGDYPFPGEAVGFVGNVVGPSELAFDISDQGMDSPTIDDDVTLYPRFMPSADQVITFGRVFNR